MAQVQKCLYSTQKPTAQRRQRHLRLSPRDRHVGYMNQSIRNLLTHLFENYGGLYFEDCKARNAKPNNEKTWTNFKALPPCPTPAL